MRMSGEVGSLGKKRKAGGLTISFPQAEGEVLAALIDGKIFVVKGRKEVGSPCLEGGSPGVEAAVATWKSGNKRRGRKCKGAGGELKPSIRKGSKRGAKQRVGLAGGGKRWREGDVVEWPRGKRV